LDYNKEQLKLVFQKTNGVCRICRGTEGPKLDFTSYGKSEVANGWEVECLKVTNHIIADNPDNWWPVHIKCNSKKGTNKTKKVRSNRNLPPIPLVPEQDMNLERMAAQIRSRAEQW
jgi:hypothetical protein